MGVEGGGGVNNSNKLLFLDLNFYSVLTIIEDILFVTISPLSEVNQWCNNPTLCVIFITYFLHVSSMGDMCAGFPVHPPLVWYATDLGKVIQQEVQATVYR